MKIIHAEGGSRRHFTLIEMLVVIAIIGVLASLLMPAMQKAIEQSRSTVCVNNLKQLGVSITQYATDHAGRFPAARVGTYYWSNKLCDAGYTPVSQLFLCPTYDDRTFTNNSNACYSYGICRDLTRSITSEATAYEQNIFKRYGKGPGNTWFLGDSVGMGWWSKLHQCFMISWNNGTYFNAHFRHDGNGNFWFLDGHAAGINLGSANDANTLYPHFQRVYTQSDIALSL